LKTRTATVASVDRRAIASAASLRVGAGAWRALRVRCERRSQPRLTAMRSQTIWRSRPMAHTRRSKPTGALATAAKA